MIDHFKSRWNGTVIRRISEGNHGWIIQWPRWPRVQVHRYRYWRMSTGILVWIQYLIDILYCYFCLWAVLDSYLVYIPPKKKPFNSWTVLSWLTWVMLSKIWVVVNVFCSKDQVVPTCSHIGIWEQVGARASLVHQHPSVWFVWSVKVNSPIWYSKSDTDSQGQCLELQALA